MLTAVCVEPDGKSYVYGDYPNYEEHAFFLQANCVTDYSPENCTSGNALNWNRNNEAIKVYKVPGTNNGVNYFDLSNWETGSGGSWQNWYVNNGTFLTTSGTNPECNSLSINDYARIEVTVFPNPFSKYFIISTQAKDLQFKLYDVSGKEIPISSNQDRKIETTTLASGIYFLNVKTKDNNQTFKLIKT